jgi:mRNA interferase RelE/StbE
MMNYRIQFKSSAAKEFLKLSLSVKQQVGESLDQLQQEPRPSGVVKLQSEAQLYRIRVGDYHIIYTIDDNDRIIKITRIRHRQDVYKE